MATSGFPGYFYWPENITKCCFIIYTTKARGLPQVSSLYLPKLSSSNTSSNHDTAKQIYVTMNTNDPSNPYDLSFVR